MCDIAARIVASTCSTGTGAVGPGCCCCMSSMLCWRCGNKVSGGQRYLRRCLHQEVVGNRVNTQGQMVVSS
jgi:hypothetical protein